MLNSKSRDYCLLKDIISVLVSHEFISALDHGIQNGVLLLIHTNFECPLHKMLQTFLQENIQFVISGFFAHPQQRRHSSHKLSHVTTSQTKTTLQNIQCWFHFKAHIIPS